MDITKISKSGFETYSWCQWLYFLKYICKFKDETGASALGGTIAHKVLELLSSITVAASKGEDHFYDDELDVFFDIQVQHDYLDLWTMCQNYYFKMPENETAAKKLTNAKINSIKDGIKWILGTKYNPTKVKSIVVEDRFLISLEGTKWIVGNNPDGSNQFFSINGVIDRIDEVEEGVYEIVDYKTGSSKHWPPGKEGDPQKTLLDFFDDIQGLMYAYYARKTFPDAKAIIVTFVYLTEKKIFSVPMGDVAMKDMEQRIYDRFIEIASNDNPKQSRGFWCKYICGLGDKTGICQKVWQEKEEHGVDFVKSYYRALNHD